MEYWHGTSQILLAPLLTFGLLCKLFDLHVINAIHRTKIFFHLSWIKTSTYTLISIFSDGDAELQMVGRTMGLVGAMFTTLGASSINMWEGNRLMKKGNVGSTWLGRRTVTEDGGQSRGLAKMGAQISTSSAGSIAFMAQWAAASHRSPGAICNRTLDDHKIRRSL